MSIAHRRLRSALVHRRLRPALAAGLVLAAGAAGLVACGSSHPSSGAHLRTLRIALDYTPNVNYMGIDAAVTNGYFAAHGIRADIVPYAGLSAETLLQSGRADLGLTYPPNIPANRAGGLDYSAVAALTQRNTIDIAVLASSPYRNVGQLSGTLYGGFGVSSDKPILEAVFAAAGVAHPSVKEINLGDEAYQALAAHRVAYSITFGGIDDVTAQLAGVHLRQFPIAHYLGATFSFPDDAFVAMDSLIHTDPSLLRAGLAALAEGYRFAAEHPARAEAILEQDNRSFLADEHAVVTATGKATAPTFLAPDGAWGHLDDADFAGLTTLLVHGGLIPAARAPAPGEDFTNSLLPNDGT